MALSEANYGGIPALSYETARVEKMRDETRNDVFRGNEYLSEDLESFFLRTRVQRSRTQKQRDHPEQFSPQHRALYIVYLRPGTGNETIVLLHISGVARSVQIYL